MNDELVWLPENSGNYSTKSGYALAKVHSGNPQKCFNWKQLVWNVQCSPKLRQFLWKLKNNALAVGETLVKRGIQVDGRCKRCGEPETIIHVMFSCITAQRVWNLTPALLKPSNNVCQSTEDLLKVSARIINLPPLGLTTPLYPWIFWVLWTSRNQLLFEDKFFSETEMVAKAIKAAKEWQASLPLRKHVSASSKDCQHSNSLPQVPANFHIIWSDAAWNGSTLAGGLGWICKESSGTVAFQGTEARCYVSSALTAEALVMKAGLAEAKASNIKDVICCTDSKVLIEAITGKKNVIAIRGILHDLGVLSNSFSSISFKFISRNRNGPADLLAKNALFILSSNLSEVANSVE